MKLFYFADFLHLKKYGAPMTYDRYVNLEHGPVPSVLMNLVNEAKDDIDSSILSDVISVEKTYEMYRIKGVREFSEEDEKYFSETEKEILKLVCFKFENANTQTIENESHEESPWKETRSCEEIPYSLATGDEDCLVTKEEIDLMMKINKE